MGNKKNLVWNTLGVGFNVFSSLFFLIIIARINTLADAGIFSFAFAFVNILYLMGTFGGRIYQVTDSKNEFQQSDYIAFRSLTSIFMIFICFTFLFFSNYDSHKNLIIVLLVLLKFIESISDVYYGIMQKNDCLYLSGQSLFIKSFFGVIVFLLVNILTKNLIFSISALILINILVFIFFDIFFVKKISSAQFSFDFKNLKKMLLNCFSFFVFTFLASMIINFPRYPIDIFLTSEMQAIYSIIVMPATSIALLGQFIIQPTIVAIADDYAKNNIPSFMNRVNKTLFLLCVVSILSIIIAFFAGIPILNFMYKINLNEYKISLVYVMVGGMFSACSYVFSVALTAMRINFHQLLTYIFSTVFAILFALVVVKKFGIQGGICSYPSIMIFQFISMYILFVIKLKKLRTLYVTSSYLQS